MVRAASKARRSAGAVDGGLKADTQALAKRLGGGAAAPIRSESEFRSVANEKKTVASIRGRVHALFDKHVEKAFDLHRGLCDDRRKYLDELDAIEASIDERLEAFIAAHDVERKARDAQRTATEAERVRGLTEAHAQALEIAGLSAAAQQVRESLILPVVSSAPLAMPAGLARKTKYGFRIIDPKRIPSYLFIIDEKGIQAIVDARGPRAAIAIPGIEVFKIERVRRTGR